MSTSFITPDRAQQTTACLHAKSSTLSIFVNAVLEQALFIRLHIVGGGFHMKMIELLQQRPYSLQS